MSWGLTSPPPEIISVPAARAGSQLERWKSEGMCYQDPGGNPLPIYLCGREPSEVEKLKERLLQTQSSCGRHLRSLYIRSLECLSLKQTLVKAFDCLLPLSGAPGMEGDEVRNRTG